MARLRTDSVCASLQRVAGAQLLSFYLGTEVGSDSGGALGPVALSVRASA